MNTANFYHKNGIFDMVFSGTTFLFYFLPITTLIYLVSPKKIKNFILFISSLVFYAWGEPFYVFLMLFSLIVNFNIGKAMTDEDEYFVPRKLNIFKREIILTRKRLLVSSVVFNLAVLFVFKYTNFAISIINTIPFVNIPLTNISLPVGISFYTFQIISYIVDVYRQDAKVQNSFIKFGTYISLFPQLIAGPIVRYNEIEAQLEERSVTFTKLSSGISRFVCGLMKKAILANSMGAVFDRITAGGIGEISVVNAWVGIIAFTFQIYFDFSGYSDMAIGLGKIFGFEFSENFRYPYTSKSVTEFWRRWHISLGTWFKEYVYIPLGGSRVDKKRLYFNLFAVWFLTGLWHGASFNFVVWGLFYWALLSLEKTILKNTLEKMPSFVKHIYLILCVMIGWVFFSIPDLKDAIKYLGIMVGIGANGFIEQNALFILTSNLLLFLVCAFASTNICHRLYEKFILKNYSYLIPFLVGAGFVLSVAYIISSSYNPFLYFRF